MTQYMIMTATPQIVEDKNGKEVKVIGFRKRIKYSYKDIFIGTLMGQENLRPDALCVRLYGSEFKVNGIIDVNDKDILSFTVIDKINFVSKDRI